MPQRDGHGLRVHPHRGIGQVVVIEQQQVRRLADHLGNLGLRSRDVHFVCRGASQPVPNQGITAHQETVRSVDLGVDRARGIRTAITALDTDLVTAGERVPRVLPDHQPAHRPVGGALDLGHQLGGAGGLQPGPRPRPQVAPGGLLQTGPQVAHLGVSKGMASEVVTGPGKEGFLADIRHQLLQDRGALGVGDAVEVLPGRLHVLDHRDDRVGRG